MVRWFARPYVAGDTLESGLDAADRLLKGPEVLTTLDLLGEDVTRPEQVQANVSVYEQMIDALAGDPRFQAAPARPSVSGKPSAFTCSGREAAGELLVRLAERARERGVALTIDMEDRHWTDLTIDWSVDLFRKGYDVGTVLQTRLNRTEADLARIPEGMRLRLVIGIYPEPADIAVTDKRVMKARMVDYARRLLDAGVFVEFASHDLEFVEEFVRDVAPQAPDRCEVQMLLGVPRGRFREALKRGDFGPALPLRIYVPFAIGWADATAYLRRRMEESPSVAWLALRNFFAARSDR
jgi:proline dehydrogenase